MRPDTVVGRITSIHLEDRDRTERRFGGNAPSFLANLYRVADVQTDMTHRSVVWTRCSSHQRPGIGCVRPGTLRDFEFGVEPDVVIYETLSGSRSRATVA